MRASLINYTINHFTKTEKYEIIQLGQNNTNINLNNYI